MRTILDVDYSSLVFSGRGKLDSLKRLFADSKEAGIDTMLWAPLACGKAYYPSRVVKPLRDGRQHAGGHHLYEILDRFDPCEEAVRLAREFDLKIHFYFRLFDDYFIGLEEDFFEANPHLWWQSRCGYIPFKGWPCYHEPAVREHKMSLFKELQSYGPDGFLVELSRSHSYYANPERAADFFGYNAVVAEEYQKRYGVDIRDFDYMEPVAQEEGMYGNGVPYYYSHRYVNPVEFDREAWHWLKGEAIDSFVRELRAANGDGELLVQGGVCPPHPGAIGDDSCAKFYLDANLLAVDGALDGFSLAGNFRSRTPEEMEQTFFPYFQGMHDSNVPVGIWLNDIFTSNGGHGDLAAAGEIEAYVQRVLQTRMDYAFIHEADFLVRNEDPAAVWAAIRELSTTPVMGAVG